MPINGHRFWPGQKPYSFFVNLAKMKFESVGRPGLLTENASIAVCLCADTFSSVQASFMLDAKEIFALVDTVPSEDTDIG